MSVIQLISGEYIDLLDPKPEQIHLSDIAYGLSHICRFNGHSSSFYSVAQHSVFVSNLVGPELAKAALLHDAAESYLGDVVAPLKSLLPEYKRIEARFEDVIAERFNLPKQKNLLIKKADLIALVTEKRDLMINHPIDSMLWADFLGIKPTLDKIHPAPPEVARHAFVMQYKKILSLEGYTHKDVVKDVTS